MARMARGQLLDDKPAADDCATDDDYLRRRPRSLRRRRRPPPRPPPSRQDFKRPPMTTLPPSTTTKTAQVLPRRDGRDELHDVCKAEDKKCRALRPSTGPSSRMTTVAPPTTTLPPKTTTEPPTTTVVAYSTESALTARGVRALGAAQVEEQVVPIGLVAVRVTVRASTRRSKSSPIVAAPGAAPTATAALASGVDTFTRCRSNS